jgi:hypothetical protein
MMAVEAIEDHPWERVHTVGDFHDRPRSGASDFDGTPYFYAGVFDESADEWLNRYVLTPLPLDVFEKVMEKWALWKRWRDAFDRGETTMETFPGFSEDRPRMKQLSAEIAHAHELLQTSGLSFQATGHFRRADRDVRPPRPGGVMAPWIVRWSRVS